MALPCPACTCHAPEGGRAHAMLACLREDDLDGALQRGLLDAAPCHGCADTCGAALLAARDARRAALQARERHRARQARLARRAAERDRAKAAPAAGLADARPAAALPDAAADALARALQRASQRRRP